MLSVFDLHLSLQTLTRTYTVYTTLVDTAIAIGPIAIGTRT